MTRCVIFLPFLHFQFYEDGVWELSKVQIFLNQIAPIYSKPFLCNVHQFTCMSTKLHLSIYVKLDRGQVRAILCGSYVFGYFLQVRHSVIPFRNGQVLLDNISENYYWVEFLQNLSISCILFT